MKSEDNILEGNIKACDLRKFQIVLLDILKEFIKICETNNLTYYAVSGTVLGAVRHQGFIPWDDDIDISMPRSDYERFLEISSMSLKSPYELRTYTNDENHIYAVSKLIDNRVKISAHTAKEKMNYYANIAIIPADGLPANKLIRRFHIYLFLIKKFLFNISVFDKLVIQDKKRPPLESFLVWFLNKFNISRFFNKKKRVMAAEKLLKKYAIEESKYCTTQIWGQYRFKTIFPIDWIGNGVLLPFEDIKIRVPIEYRKYLAQIYGEDYMDYPPVEKRVAAHASEVIFPVDETDKNYE
ncbi:MAG: LicD family protein [Lachnospiraceae bacterium]|nr:LicD family protein [Lachnospiraceae bacterium]